MSTSAELEQRFTCPKCEHVGARVRKVSMSGGTLSRMMNFQHNQFLAASCGQCGYTEFYDAEVLGAQGGHVLDLLFGI